MKRKMLRKTKLKIYNMNFPSITIMIYLMFLLYFMGPIGYDILLC